MGFDEEENVQKVYNKIAPHFDKTRFAVWPVVEAFMKDIKPFSIGFDGGCGNGKYMKLRQDSYLIGGDNSIELLKICVKKDLEVVYMNLFDQSIKPNCLDYVISIAVLHHFSNPERRMQVLVQFYEAMRRNSKILVFVWAKEQPKFENVKDQDILVPWHTEENGKMVTYERYYHVFVKGELDELMEKAGFQITNTGYDKGNWYVEGIKL